MKNFIWKYLIIIIYFLFFYNIFSDNQNIIKPYQSNKFLSTAKNFIYYGNYFEAITEYKRYLYNNKYISLGRKASIYLQIGDLYYKSSKLDKAKKNYFLSYRFFNNYKREKSFLQLKILNTLQYSNITVLPYIFNILKINDFSEKEKNYIILNTSRYLLINNKNNSAKIILNSLSDLDKNQQSILKTIKDYMNHYKTKYSKYNLFYSIFPGGFFFRYNKLKKGFLSFISVSSLAAGGIYSFQKGYSITGFILSFFSFKFYLDSIWESIRELKDMNEEYLKEEQIKLVSSSDRKIDFTENIKISISVLY